MRRKKLLPFVVLALLSCSIVQAGPFGSWAAHGVVVKKTFRPSPLSHSLGLDGIYRLELRDRDNKVRRQMVTRAVFLAYEIGDEFNELTAPGLGKSAQRSVAVEVNAKAAAKADSLGEDLEIKLESRNRLASANFPQEALPETEGF